MNLLDRILPSIDDPTLTSEERDIKLRERNRFVFAFVVVMGAMLSLPIGGAVYVILVEMKIVPPPF